MAKRLPSLFKSSFDRRHLLASVMFLALLLPADRIAERLPNRKPVETIIAEIGQVDGFRLVEWEVREVAAGLMQRARMELALRASPIEDRQRIVEDYFAASAEIQRSLRSLDQARGSDSDPVIGKSLLAAQARQDNLADAANAAMAMQISDYLAEQGISTDLIRPALQLGLPPLSLRLGAPVFFSFSELPLLLVVSPRDRITISSTTFLRNDMTLVEWDRIEQSVEATGGVSSVVLPIGGFASYPSMLPFETSQHAAMQTIAHEWVHHYLALKPLGWQYFDNYSMRSINETVADIAGEEIATAVLQRGAARQLDEEVPSSRSRDFSKLMADIRGSVEDILARGDVDGAERYMVERKDWLASKGFRLRKLNTAYLTFYGAYSDTGNPFEPKLRSLRERTGSLAAFLRSASSITRERDLDGLLLK